MIKIDINDFFKNSFCISIDSVRRRIFSETFSKSFPNCLKPVPNFFDGYRNKDLGGKYCCELGHCSIIRMAKALSLPFVAIFEDDAYPRMDAEKRLTSVLSTIPEDARIVILGYNKHNGVKKYNDKLSILTSWCWGSHSYIIFKDAYDSYLNEYDKNTKHVADDFYGILKCSYISNCNLFIQRCEDKSMNGYSGYILDNVGHKEPPDGFCRSEDLIGIPIDMERIASVCKLKGFDLKGGKCIVIGSNPSIKNVSLGNYVDSFDGTVIRINRIADEKFLKNYGKRTDFIITCEWYEKNVNKFPDISRIVLNDSDINKISSQFSLPKDKWLTTGMIGILMSLYAFEHVEILGFGIPDICENGRYNSLHDGGNKYDMGSKEFHHDLNYEHSLLGIFKRINFKERLHICEQECLNN